MWLGYAVYGLAFWPWGLIAIVPQAIILGSILGVTGIPPTENQAIRSKGDAAEARASGCVIDREVLRSTPRQRPVGVCWACCHDQSARGDGRDEIVPGLWACTDPREERQVYVGSFASQKQADAADKQHRVTQRGSRLATSRPPWTTSAPSATRSMRGYARSRIGVRTTSTKAGCGSACVRRSTHEAKAHRSSHLAQEHEATAGAFACLVALTAFGASSTLPEARQVD